MAPWEVEAWFQAFTRDPLTFHGLSYAIGVHQRLSGVPGAVTRFAQTLGHKSQAIQLVNARLPALDGQAMIELALLTIAILWRVNDQAVASDSEEFMLLNSYLPTADWLCLYGKTDTVDAHAGAVRFLVERLGGLNNLQLPGLAYGIAM